MASAIATARPERAREGTGVFRGSRLGRTILALNLLALLVLVAGSLVLNEFRQGLVLTRQESLAAQAELLAEVLAAAATRGEPVAAMEAGAPIVLRAFVPQGQRARLFDAEGRLLTDSYRVSDDVEVSDLPSARRPGEAAPPGESPERRERRLREATLALAREHLAARGGDGSAVANLRPSEAGDRVVSVSIPIRRVARVVGVLTLEAGDLDAIVAAQRAALIPFILIAVGVILASSVLLHFFVAVPVLRLARAADSVRLARAREISLPDLAGRKDEVGALTRSLEGMTGALSQRMDAIERFAADVAHEIRNPLASIGSAVETLDLVEAEAPRARLMGILKQDVRRLDRLVTDIANASRVDAELSREAPRPTDVGALLEELVALYADRPSGPARVSLDRPARHALLVSGRDGPLGQVFRNLIDNAVSFSPAGGEVRVGVASDRRDGAAVVRITIDDTGPGVPAENLETVFERFYTSRPKGAAFGGNSGLGLSIARQIVEAHGGRVWAENRGEGGARFAVELPQARS